MSYKIYHNPRCRKSREALALLNEQNQPVEVILYMKESLSQEELKLMLQKLNMSAESLLRKQEKLFKAEFKQMNFQEEEWIQTLLDHPQLMERPIVEKGNRAVVARPADRISELN